VSYYTPGLGVDITTSGTSVKLALTYYYITDTKCSSVSACNLKAGFATSTNSGASWTFGDVSGSFSLSLLPSTSQGQMFGDYVSSSWSNGSPFGTFVVANPFSGSCHFNVSVRTNTFNNVSNTIGYGSNACTNTNPSCSGTGNTASGSVLNDLISGFGAGAGSGDRSGLDTHAGNMQNSLDFKFVASAAARAIATASADAAFRSSSMADLLLALASSSSDPAVQTSIGNALDAANQAQTLALQIISDSAIASSFSVDDDTTFYAVSDAVAGGFTTIDLVYTVISEVTNVGNLLSNDVLLRAASRATTAADGDLVSIAEASGSFSLAIAIQD
jgi:hypothetical protein